MVVTNPRIQQIDGVSVLSAPGNRARRPRSGNLGEGCVKAPRSDDVTGIDQPSHCLESNSPAQLTSCLPETSLQEMSLSYAANSLYTPTRGRVLDKSCQEEEHQTFTCGSSSLCTLSLEGGKKEKNPCTLRPEAKREGSSSQDCSLNLTHKGDLDSPAQRQPCIPALAQKDSLTWDGGTGSGPRHRPTPCARGSAPARWGGRASGAGGDQGADLGACPPRLPEDPAPQQGTG